MTDTQKTTLDSIAQLFDSQEFMVLSTQKDGQPYASLIAFAAGRDLSRIYFLTASTTRKYENLICSPKVAILVNNSRNKSEDIFDAMAVTGTGTARRVEPGKRDKILDRLLNRHPNLTAFAREPASEVICITINRYFAVNQFQNVVEIRM